MSTIDEIKYKDLSLETSLSDDKTLIDLDDLGSDLNKDEFGELIMGLTELYHKMEDEQ